MCKKGKKPEILYHYCSLDTFVKIIKNHTIRFSDITKSNDSDEIEFVFEIYKRYLQQKYSNDTNCNLKLDLLRNGVKDDLKNHKFYCFCMSSKKDLLSQWRGYAPDGGVAIGFNYNELTSFINNTKVAEGKIKINHITYVSKQNPIKLEEVFNKWDNSILINNYSKLLACAVLYKNDGFIEEGEYRMYFANSEKPYNNSIIPFISVGNNIIHVDFQLLSNCKDFKSYYDIPITLGLIDEIIIGPKLQLSHETLKSFLKLYDTKSEINFEKLNIEMSKLTYR